MKKAILLVFVLTFAFVAVSKEKAKDKSLMKSGSVVWAGLDYSMMRLIGDGLKPAQRNYSHIIGLVTR